MSTAVIPGSFPAEEPTVALAASVLPASVFVRRRATLEQGRALETLGHAVEYLVDSAMFDTNDRRQGDDQESIQLLMRLSRAVFAECPEVVPLRSRVVNLGRRMLGRSFSV